jgi:pSer/pThr/pTyr-binding forkhead associated (FHA) protein
MTGIILLILRAAMTLALYAFLGWTILLMWRALKQQAFFISGRKIVPLTLELGTAAASPHTFHFTTGDVLVGRDPDCECALTDETISARHVRFSYHHNQWWVEDLGSRNGTLLNGVPLATPTVVVNSDVVKCGQTSLRVHIQAESSDELHPTPHTETIP